MTVIKSILFDLDGTLVDTAPDLLFALNEVRSEHFLAPLPMQDLREIISLGSPAMIKLAFGFTEGEEEYGYLKERFLNFYLQHIADATCLFPQMDDTLKFLEDKSIPWGIVTNKATKPTFELLKILGLDKRSSAIVCGDTLKTCKPDPAPILYACQLMEQDPSHCLYVGDAITDIAAGKSAGTKSLVAMYGYIHAAEDPTTWGADGYINQPIDLINWVSEYLQTESA